MSGLENLKARLNYMGGDVQLDRMNEDKLRSLKKALLYSYQAATAKLSDGREFRCLMNPDKLKNDYEDKIISIPFVDTCLNENDFSDYEGDITQIGMKVGDTFEWAENNTFWIVYLQRYEETAYFRAEVRKCDYEVTINDNVYKIFLKGPDKSSIAWHSRNTSPQVSWNDIDYDATIYITKNDETEDYFHRFSKIKIDGKNWEIQVVDSMSTEGIIEVLLKEDYTNSIKEEIESNTSTAETISTSIIGNTIVYPYDEVTYTIEGVDGGNWSVDNNKVQITSKTENTVTLYINTGKSGQFTLSYIASDSTTYDLNVKIGSL